MTIVLLVLKHHARACGRKRLDTQVYPNGSTAMSRDFMLHLYRDGGEPPACTRGNDGAHDLARPAERFGHVDGAKLGDAYRLPINRKFIVGKIEAQAIPFLAFKARKPALFTILAWMLELRERTLFLHPPEVSESLPAISEFLFGSAFRDLVAPGKLLTLDPIILRLEVFHLGPFVLCPLVFPASKCPIVGMARHPARFAKVDFLFWCWIESDHMRPLHKPILLFLQCRLF